MKKHQGYKTKGKDVQCMKCEEWIGPAKKCMLIQDGIVTDDKRGLQRTAKTFHGVLCVICYEEL